MNTNKNYNNKESIQKMKYDIANEFGINLGPEASSRTNGSVGGGITKRLVRMCQKQLNSFCNSK